MTTVAKSTELVTESSPFVTNVVMRLFLLLLAGGAHALVSTPATRSSASPRRAIVVAQSQVVPPSDGAARPAELDVRLLNLSPDIARRVREAEEKVEIARVEFEREKKLKERQRRKRLFNAVSRSRLRQTAIFGFEQVEQELLEMQENRKGQMSFNEATPFWVQNLGRAVFKKSAKLTPTSTN